MIRIPFVFLLAISLLAACSPAVVNPDLPVTDRPTTGEPVDMPSREPEEYAPQPGDVQLLRGSVYLDTADLLALESFPVQYRLALAGSLPDPCHALRVQVTPDPADQNFRVEVYSVADATQVCIQILKPFNASIPLSTQGLMPGKYGVYVNGQKIGELDLP